MANYRDDTQETAVIGSFTWAGMSALIGESARAASVLLFGLAVLHSDNAAASDAVQDRSGVLIAEAARALDVTTGSLTARAKVLESARAVDLHKGVVRVLHAESALASDLTTGIALSILTERATAADDVLAQRRVNDLVNENARAGDFSGSFSSALIAESAEVKSVVTDKLRARDMSVGITSAYDEVVDEHRAAVALITESASAKAYVTGRLNAADLIVEQAMYDAYLVQDITIGQAWTANIDTWAMSRYEPHAFKELAVIDGRLYGVGDDGLYVMDSQDQEQSARIKTGALDVGGQSLTIPYQAVMEYSLDGDASLSVTTTQSGSAQTYTYPLRGRQSIGLTSGRFEFGRGLCGRHFTFELRLIARSGEINDLRVNTAPSKRRV